MTGCGKALLLLSRDIRVEYYFIIKGFKKSFKKKKIDFEKLQGFFARQYNRFFDHTSKYWQQTGLNKNTSHVFT